MEKHKNIPADATWNAEYNRWELGQKNEQGKEIGTYVGEYFEWDMNGAPILKHLYDRQTGSVIEEHTYNNGVLGTSKVYTAESQTQSFYHRGIEPPVVSKSIPLIRKKALLAAAEVADQHKNLLNHQEIFEEFNLPHDSYKLRKLANNSK